MKSARFTKTALSALLAAALGLTPLSGILPDLGALSHTAAAAPKTTPAPWDLELKNAPFKKNGAVMIPVKELTDYLDLQVMQSTDKKHIYISSPYQSIRLAAGQSKAVDALGKPLKLQTAPVIRKGVTYVPASLLTQSFGIPVSWKGKSVISIAAVKRYASGAAGSMLFWLNRETRELTLGLAGKQPKPAGKVSIEHVDLLGIVPRKVQAESYVVDVFNFYGEPHIFETRTRVLLYKGRIMKQGSTAYVNFAGRNTKPDVNGFKGNAAIMDGSTLQLVHPTGKVIKTYDLAAITGVKDDFVVEALHEDFLLVRPYKTATLFIIHPVSKKSVLIYPELLEGKAKELVEDYPPNEAGFSGDSLTFKSYDGQTLTFEWSHPFAEGKKSYSYKLPF